MNKNIKSHLLTIVLLLANQTHGIDEQEKNPTLPKNNSNKPTSKSYWTWENGTWVLVGAAGVGAAVGLGALTYYNQDAINNWWSPQNITQPIINPVETSAQVTSLEPSITQENIAKTKERKPEESVIEKQANITLAQDAITKKQTWLEYFNKNLTPVSEVINSENKPVNSWGFYTQTDAERAKNQLTPEEELAGRDERRVERTQRAITEAQENQADIQQQANDLNADWQDDVSTNNTYFEDIDSPHRNDIPYSPTNNSEYYRAGKITHPTIKLFRDAETETAVSITKNNNAQEEIQNIQPFSQTNQSTEWTPIGTASGAYRPLSQASQEDFQDYSAGGSKHHESLGLN